MSDEKKNQKNQEYDYSSKTPLQDIKDKSMGFVANISERVEIWSKIIRIRVKISSLNKEIEENMKKVGAAVFKAFSNEEADKQIEIKQEMRKHLQRIRALNKEIEELEALIRSLEEKRQEMIQLSQVKIEKEKEEGKEKEEMTDSQKSTGEKEEQGDKNLTDSNSKKES